MQVSLRSGGRLLPGVAIAAGVALAAGAGGQFTAVHGATPTPSNIVVARFFGSVSSSGGSVPNGATVTASIDGVACGVGTVAGTQYTVDIQELPGCITPGKKVAFAVNGQPSSPSGAVPNLQGAAVQLNLAV